MSGICSKNIKKASDSIKHLSLTKIDISSNIHACMHHLQKTPVNYTYDRTNTHV